MLNVALILIDVGGSTIIINIMFCNEMMAKGLHIGFDL